MVLDITDKNTLNIITEKLKNGEVGVLPCDTIYGLVSAYKIGEQPLKLIKARDAVKPFLVLATLQQVSQICKTVPDSILKLWPAPLTVVLYKKEGGTIAVRVPSDAYLQNLCEKVGMPLYSTSVNISGEPTLTDINSIIAKFENKVGFIVRGNEIQGTTPSTVVDATVKPFKILRVGQFDASSLVERSGLS